MKKQECVVLVPGLNEKKRFLVPDNMQIHEIIHLILELLREEYPELDSEEEMLNLFKRRTGEKTDCLAEINIAESDELILG